MRCWVTEPYLGIASLGNNRTVLNQYGTHRHLTLLRSMLRPK
jgi:hypothetical protein